MVVAEAALSRRRAHRLRRHHLAPLRACLLVGGACSRRSDEIDPLARDLAVGGCEALGQHEFVRQAQDVIDQPGAGRIGIFLDREHAGEVASARHGLHLDRIEAEADACIGNMPGRDRWLRRAAAAPAASRHCISPRSSRAARSSVPPAPSIAAEQPRAIGFERSGERGGGGIQRAQDRPASVSASLTASSCGASA